MKVLSLAWKYHPSITSGVGVACEGINNALSKMVDLKVIYPKVTKIQVSEELILGSEDLTVEQRKLIEEEYIEFLENGNFVLALLSGIIISYVSFMKLAKYLLENHPVLIWSFF